MQAQEDSFLVALHPVPLSHCRFTLLKKKIPPRLVRTPITLFHPAIRHKRTLMQSLGVSKEKLELIPSDMISNLSWWFSRKEGNMR